MRWWWLSSVEPEAGLPPTCQCLAQDLDEDGVLDEVSEVETTLWEHHRLVYMIFDYYASLGSSNDIFHKHSFII